MGYDRRAAEQSGRDGETRAAWYLRLRGWRILDRRVRTGLYCAYEPDEGDAIRWVVQADRRQPPLR